MAKVKKVAKKVKAPARAKSGTGVGACARELILKGLDNAAVLEGLKKKIPECHASAATVAWYRNDMIQQGVKGVKTSREVKAGQAKPKAVAKAPKAKASRKVAAVTPLPEPVSTASVDAPVEASIT